MEKRLLVPDLIKRWKSGEKLVMLTAYDYTFARLLESAGVDLLLVGDSLSTTVQGQPTTLPVTMDEMVYHVKLVVRGTSRAFVIADMPFMSYQSGSRDALKNAGRFMKEAGAAAVKLEGGASVARIVRALTNSGIPVMGHLGLLPQSYHTMGGYHVQGRSEEDADRILQDAKKLEDAGAFSIVLEGIPSELARTITESIHIPTIGIGAGPHCSGQVLVIHDLLGLTADENQASPKFVKRYAELSKTIREAVSQYAQDVRGGKFPGREHSYEGGPLRQAQGKPLRQAQDKPSNLKRWK